MPRPKSDDPKKPLTIRLRSSAVDQLGGEAKARSAIEAMVERALAKRVEPPAPPKPASPKVSVSIPFGGDVVRRPMQKTLKR